MHGRHTKQDAERDASEHHPRRARGLGEQGPGPGRRRVNPAHLLWFALPVGFVVGDMAVDRWGPWPGSLVGGAVAGAVAGALARTLRDRRR